MLLTVDAEDRAAEHSLLPLALAHGVADEEAPDDVSCGVVVW